MFPPLGESRDNYDLTPLFAQLQTRKYLYLSARVKKTPLIPVSGGSWWTESDQVPT